MNSKHDIRRSYQKEYGAKQRSKYDDEKEQQRRYEKDLLRGIKIS